MRTAATRQVTAGAAELWPAEIRCSPFYGIFVETKNTDQRRYWSCNLSRFLLYIRYRSRNTMWSRLPFPCRRLSGGG